jgi:ABC-type transport system involved in multi-copper enzyme maturation permease subunit
MEINPVLRKDILGLFRLRRIGALQFVFVAVLGVLVMATWPQQGVVSLASRGQDSLLLGLILGQLVLLILFVPGVASFSITSEREQGTLDMLYASRLSPGQLIFGKLLSAIGFPLLLLVSGLPFVGLLNYRGDVDFFVLLCAYSVLVTAAVLLAVVSLVISALCSLVSTAVVVSYVVALTICGGVLVPAAIMLASQGGLGAQILHYTRSISPIAATLSLLRPHLAEFGGRAGGIAQNTGESIAGLPPAWKIFFPFAGGLIVAGLIALILVLRKAPGRTNAVDDSASANKDKRPTLGRRILFLIDPNRQRKPIGNFNPIIAKEARTNQLRSGRWMIRIFYGALFISLGLASMALYGGQTQYADLLHYVAAVLVAFQISVITMIDPSLTGPAISSEVENTTFEMLRLTPLSSGQIFWGKFVPAFFPAMLPIIALLPAYGVICFVNPIYVRSVLLMLPVFTLTVVLCCATGMVCSTFMKNSASATVTNYFIIAAIVVLPLLAWLATGVFIDARLSYWLAQLSPFVMAVNLLPNGSPEITRLLPQHLMLIGGLCLFMLVLARLRLELLLRKGRS